MISRIQAFSLLLVILIAGSSQAQTLSPSVSTSATLGPGVSQGSSRAVGDKSFGNVHANPEFVRSYAFAVDRTQMAFSHSNAIRTPFGIVNSSFGLNLGSARYGDSLPAVYLTRRTDVDQFEPSQPYLTPRSPGRTY
jgi:hypothetical protein